MLRVLITVLFYIILTSHGNLNCESKCKNFKKYEKSVIVKDTDGRLGNAMFSYQTLLSLRDGYGYNVYMGDKMGRLLTYIFPNMSIALGSQYLCGFHEVQKDLNKRKFSDKMSKLKNYILNSGASDSEFSISESGKIILSPEVMTKYKIDIHKFVHGNDFSFLDNDVLTELDSEYPWRIWSNKSLLGLREEKYLTNHAFILYPGHFSLNVEEAEMISKKPEDLARKLLEKEFNVKESFVNEAKKRVESILKIHISKNFKKSKNIQKLHWRNFTLIAIHSRRNDHIEYERVHNIPTLRPSYYFEAMELFRQRFKHLIFLYISDDVDWGQSHLESRTRRRLKDLYFIEHEATNPEDNLAFDLAIIKNCQHAIISHGTLSYWIGFLTGGSVVTPEHFSKYRNGKRQNYYYFNKHPLDHPLPKLYMYL